MSLRHVYLAALASALLILTPLDAAATPVFIKASKAFATTRLVSKGWTPGEHINLKLGGTTLGTIMVDASGSVDASLGNLDSRVASIKVGDQLTFESELTGDTATIQVVLDPGRFAWVAVPGINQGPLTSVLTNTELAAAGFVPTFVGLTGTSSNASIISQLTVFDIATDSISTTGFYNLSGEGAVFGTFSVAGNFSNLTDLTTGEILPITFAEFQFTDQIGTTVPEPTTMLLLATGLAGVGVTARWRRKSHFS